MIRRYSHTASLIWSLTVAGKATMCIEHFFKKYMRYLLYIYNLKQMDKDNVIYSEGGTFSNV